MQKLTSKQTEYIVVIEEEKGFFEKVGDFVFGLFK